ncbi:MAG: hypothetical protein FD143_2325 [Ignavibacteria bacterium]|nr:MAG: hypothetical protein FD143_2325 [Ignavibacteria bacterium]
MSDSIVKTKAFGFAVRIVNLSKILNSKNEFVLSKQIMNLLAATCPPLCFGRRGSEVSENKFYLFASRGGV